MGMEMVILMKQVNIFKDFTNILIKNLFSGSSLNTSSNSFTPRQVYMDLVLACVGDTMGKVVVLRSGEGRGVKQCDQGGRWSGWGARPILLRGAVHHVALRGQAADSLGPDMARHWADRAQYSQLPCHRPLTWP